MIHVARPRLTRRLAAAPVGLIEAGGGYGKSVLAAELRRGLGIASAEAVLERPVDGSAELVGALRRGLRRAGLSDAAAALSDPARLVDALDAVGGPVLLVVDEVQRASGLAVELLVVLARELPEQHRLLLVGRRLDPLLAELRTGLGAVHLTADDLAFDDDEVASLLAEQVGYEPARSQVAHLRRVASGWPAATVLAGLWLAREGTVPRGTLAQLLDGLLAGVSAADRARLARLAHLPLLSEEVAAAVAGPGALRLLIDAGLPVRAGRPGWLELPDPVRDALAAHDVDARPARRAGRGRRLRRRGRVVGGARAARRRRRRGRRAARRAALAGARHARSRRAAGDPLDAAGGGAGGAPFRARADRAARRAHGRLRAAQDAARARVRAARGRAAAA